MFTHAFSITNFSVGSAVLVAGNENKQTNKQIIKQEHPPLKNFIFIYLAVLKFVFPSCSRVLSCKHLTHLGTQQIFVELNFYYSLCSFCLFKKPLFLSLSQRIPLIFFFLGLKALGKHFPRSLQPVSEIDKKFPDSSCTHH